MTYIEQCIQQLQNAHFKSANVSQAKSDNYLENGF